MRATTIHDRLKRLRLDKGLTQAALAELIGIHLNTWKKIETGKSVPSLPVLAKIAKGLRVSAGSLIFGDGAAHADAELWMLYGAIEDLPRQSRRIVCDLIDILEFKTRVAKAQAGQTSN